VPLHSVKKNQPAVFFYRTALIRSHSHTLLKPNVNMSGPDLVGKELPAILHQFQIAIGSHDLDIWPLSPKTGIPVVCKR